MAEKKEMPFASAEIPDINGVLSSEDMRILEQAVLVVSLAGLEAILRRVYHMGDVRILNMTWKEIVIFFGDYISSKPKK